MPPQAGLFALPYPSTQRNRLDDDPLQQLPVKRRRRTDRDILLSRDDLGRFYGETLARLKEEARILTQDPAHSPAYTLRLYPLIVERAAQLAQLEYEEDYALECDRTAYNDEIERVEDEWKKGSERIRERLLEGIEERRRRAREEKDGEGVTDASLDAQSRSHITRKLRNKMNPSPPPTPPRSGSGGIPMSMTTTNPNSLSIDELPSPFPLPLTSLPSSSTYSGNGNGRRKQKSGSASQNQAQGGLGKAIPMLTGSKEVEIESDLGEIRRYGKRKRQAAAAFPLRS